MKVRTILKALLCGSSILLATACGGGSPSTRDTAPAPTTDPAPTPPPPAKVPFDVPQLESLTVTDIEIIIAQAVAEADARNQPAVISIVDRVGNVLAVFAMNGTLDTTTNDTETTRSGPSGLPADNKGVQGIEIVPRSMTAISKAVTGAYLASMGNAFTTRTASQIVQEHFPPAPTTIGLESGPLFGVQFSQLPCSDLNRRATNPDGTINFGADGRLGPQRAPVGLSADPGGMPLYKNGVVVGGIGISIDNDYGFDTNILDFDTDIEELVAIAGATGFEAEETIRANRISVDGTFLRFSDATPSDLFTDPTVAPSFGTINGSDGFLAQVNGYFGDLETPGSAAIRPGTAYGSEESGMRPARNDELDIEDAYVLTDGFGNNRYPPRAGTDGSNVSQPLTEAEVNALMEEAFGIIAKSRAQIRQPLGSVAQVSVSIVDTNGVILAVARTPDAPIFGTDVSLQKARTATFFSGPHAAFDLDNKTTGAVPDAVRADPSLISGQLVPDPNERDYVQIVRDFVNDQNALTGDFAFADRSGGNLSRPYFPDGEVGTINGPLSLPIEQWSPLATGLQTDLVLDNIVEHIAFVAQPLLPTILPDTQERCTFLPEADDPSDIGENRLQNGIQIFPGSVPIYRGNELIGGIGVSGDGIDQDDMISFLGLHNAGVRLATINNAPVSIRADNIVIPVNGENIRLRYVSCPFTPFLNSDAQNVCQGK